MALPGWLHLVEQLAPMVLMFTPLAPIAPFVAQGISLAEQIPGATGEQKKSFAMQLALMGAQATNLAKGHELLVPDQLQAMTGSTIDLIVAATNLVHRAPVMDPPPPTA